MPVLRLLMLLFLVLTGCHPAGDTGQQNNTCNTSANASTEKYHSGRGALLATRFASLEELKSVIQVEYHPGTNATDSVSPVDCYVTLRHCSSGREVSGILASGISEGDILKAKREGAFGERC
ncbi:MAG: hypothetical protein ABIO24_01365, partial [Saprospiraceae bacterium]